MNDLAKQLNAECRKAVGIFCAIPLPSKGKNLNQKRLLQYVYIFNYYSQFYIVTQEICFQTGKINPS